MFDQLQIAQDRRQRRTQLVRHRGGEVVLLPHQLLGALDVVAVDSAGAAFGLELQEEHRHEQPGCHRGDDQSQARAWIRDTGLPFLQPNLGVDAGLEPRQLAL